jgi:hypothetical protein
MTDQALTTDHEPADDGGAGSIRPGDMLNLFEYQTIRFEFAAAAGLRPAQVLMTPYGYPPMPRPPAPQPDGTGKLPDNLALEFTGHPVYWLDPATRQQSRDETDDELAIRLYLELVDREYLNPADGALRNPLAGAGLDIRDPGDRARLARYAAGCWDPLLCDLAIGPNPATPPGAVAAEAARLHALHAAAYADFVQEFRAFVHGAVSAARISLRAGEADRDLDPVVRAAEEMRAAAAAGRDHLGPRAAFDAAYRHVLATITRFDTDRAILLQEVDRRRHLDAPRGAASYADEVVAADVARRDGLEPHMAGIYADPTDERLLGVLYRSLRTAYVEALRQGREVLAQAERVVFPEFERPAPAEPPVAPS